MQPIFRSSGSTEKDESTASSFPTGVPRELSLILKEIKVILIFHIHLVCIYSHCFVKMDFPMWFFHCLYNWMNSINAIDANIADNNFHACHGYAWFLIKIASVISLCCQEFTFTFSDYRFLFLSLSLSLSQVITDKIRDDEESASIEGDWKFAAMVRRRSIEFVFIKVELKSSIHPTL